MNDAPIKESSLTSPEDRDLQNKWKPDQSSLNLTEPQVTLAMEELNVKSYVEKFPRVDRTYADPPPPQQTYGLISFVPAKGATPNENGVYGFAKLRGNYATDVESNQRAEFIIRNVDSYHHIFHCYVGRPFPITESSKFSAETNSIDIRKQVAESISSDLKSKKDEEQRKITEIKEKETALTQDVSKDVDPYELYITLKVKKAQLVWSWLEHQKKMEEVKNIIINTREQLDELDKTNPTFSETYFDKYVQARKDAGIDEDSKTSESNFIKYLVEDAELPF